MELIARTCSSQQSDSTRAGDEVGKSLMEAFGDKSLQCVVLYGAVNHDQAALVRTLRGVVGPKVPIVGCSSQGVMTRGAVREGGFYVGAMGFGGSSLKSGTAVEHEIAADTRAKGARLAKSVLSQLGAEPKVLVLLYDPLCGADVHELIAGVREHINCPIVGGGASQPWGPMVKTYQYFGDEVFSHGAVALGLGGPFTAELGVCHGTSPTGLTMTLTRADANRLLEIDGRPALEVWREITGWAEGETIDQNHVAAWAIGVERPVAAVDGKTHSAYAIRAAFGFDPAEKSITVQAAIPQNTKIMFHHRTTAAVLEGTKVMGGDLSERIGKQRVWAVLGFECGARTSPFLGSKATTDENVALHGAVAPDAPWLGMMAWGEIAPVGGEPAFHNYTYPLVVFTAA
jgi:hypothetical protein